MSRRGLLFILTEKVKIHVVNKISKKSIDKIHSVYYTINNENKTEVKSMDEREFDAFWMAKKMKGLPAEIRKRISYLIDDAVLLSGSRSNAPPHASPARQTERSQPQ